MTPLRLFPRTFIFMKTKKNSPGFEFAFGNVFFKERSLLLRFYHRGSEGQAESRATHVGGDFCS